MSLKFEWDEDKAKANLRKHKVSFHEATTVFHDLYIATMPDPDHSESEPRYIVIGHSANNRLLVVVYTERDEVTRIISGRTATAQERKAYEENT